MHRCSAPILFLILGRKVGRKKKSPRMITRTHLEVKPPSGICLAALFSEPLTQIFFEGSAKKKKSLRVYITLSSLILIKIGLD